MTNLISAINRIAFTIGNLEVAWYGILIVLGMMTGLFIVMSQCKRINLTTDDTIEFFLWVIPLAVVMGRLMYVFVRPEDYFDPEIWAEDSTQAFVDMIALWDGGITIIGGILGGFIGVVLFSIRKRKQANFGQILDLIVPALLVGQLFGRVGNFINQEAFGKPASLLGIPEKFPFAIFIDSPSGVEAEYREMVYSNMNQIGPDGTLGGWFAATFFYEMCWNAIGAAFAFFVWRKNKKYPGILAFFYFMWYFLGRGLLEFVRMDAVPVTQTLCFVIAPIAVVFGVIYILFRENRIAFRKVNTAAVDGTLDSLVLTKWEVDNYNFTAKIFAKPNKFWTWLYGTTEFVPAEGIAPASKEAIAEYKLQVKEQNKVLAEEEKAKRKAEREEAIQKFKDFFSGKKKTEVAENTECVENTTETTEVVVENDIAEGNAETVEENHAEEPEKVENNESSDEITETEIKDQE